MDADLNLARESAFGNLAVEGGAGKPGATKHGLKADDPFGVRHGMQFHLLELNEAPREKN